MIRRCAIWSLVLASVFGLSGCIEGLFRKTGGFDQRPMTVQTVSLFNQRDPSRLAKRSWKGDWIFRRDRLDMIDAELRNTKPDLLLLQDVIAKVGSTAESDRRILSAGSLLDYEWRDRKVESYADTQEIQSLAIAVGVPNRFVKEPEGERDLWLMGTGGYLEAATFEYEDQPVTVFNVQMPAQTDTSYLWYSFVQERVTERLKRTRSCPKRIIVGGLMPGDEGARRFSQFIQTLQLRDVSSGFCQIASKCFTATPTNDIYMATVGDESPTRVDRIFAHQSALVYSSGRNFDDSDPNNRYAREFGLPRLWPTQRFGWVAQLRLARCTEQELEEAFL